MIVKKLKNGALLSAVLVSALAFLAILALPLLWSRAVTPGSRLDGPPRSAAIAAPAVARTPTDPKIETVATAPGQGAPASADRWFGAWVPGAPKSMSHVASLESEVGGDASVVHYFTNTMYGFDPALASAAVGRGSIPLVTLEFWNPANGVNQPSLSLKSISGGSMDTYLHTYAKNAKAFGKTLWLRPFHEMNGNWYPWGGTVNGNTPADLIVAWKHVKDIFTAEGATNVKFVWCPNASSVPNTAANAISAYWPGDAYVDYVALDGYNWGGTSWTSFSGVFGTAYAAVTALSAKPVFIAETGSSETGGSKSAWVADMFKVIPTSFPRIVGVTWFDENKEHDWRVDSSSASLAAFKLGVATF